MTVTSGRTARVRVDYSQYQVAAGPEMTVGDDSVPGILRDMGEQAVAVLSGLPSGVITVTAQAVATAPAEVDPGWDVVAETDLDCPEGVISVLDWGGPDHPELGDLATAGPARYRLRVHARDRGDKNEAHHLLTWPAPEPAPPGLLTPMDSSGRLLAGEEPDDAPPMDALELAAGAAIRQLATLVSARDAPVLSGELTGVRSAATVPGTPRKVWNEVSTPQSWLANRGGGNPADLLFVLLDEPGLGVRCGVIVDEPPARIAFQWSWTTSRWADVANVIAAGRDRELELPRALPGQPFWDWALRRELPDRVTRSPFYGHPWARV